MCTDHWVKGRDTDTHMKDETSISKVRWQNLVTEAAGGLDPGILGRCRSQPSSKNGTEGLHVGRLEDKPC